MDQTELDIKLNKWNFACIWSNIVRSTYSPKRVTVCVDIWFFLWFKCDWWSEWNRTTTKTMLSFSRDSIFFFIHFCCWCSRSNLKTHTHTHTHFFCERIEQNEHVCFLFFLLLTQNLFTSRMTTKRMNKSFISSHGARVSFRKKNQKIQLIHLQ